MLALLWSIDDETINTFEPCKLGREMKSTMIVEQFQVEQCGDIHQEGHVVQVSCTISIFSSKLHCPEPEL